MVKCWFSQGFFCVIDTCVLCELANWYDSSLFICLLVLILKLMLLELGLLNLLVISVVLGLL